MKIKALLIPTITLVSSAILIKLLILPVLNAMIFSISAAYILY